ncbi:MAG TPA: hypothetical protein VF002_09560 [Gaiellaceae bacterium]
MTGASAHLDAMKQDGEDPNDADDRRGSAASGQGAGRAHRQSEVIEEALRRELGFDLLDRLWQGADLPEEQALALAVEAQHKTRRRRR